MFPQHLIERAKARCRAEGWTVIQWNTRDANGKREARFEVRPFGSATGDPHTRHMTDGELLEFTGIGIELRAMAAGLATASPIELCPIQPTPGEVRAVQSFYAVVTCFAVLAVMLMAAGVVQLIEWASATGLRP